jgi:hypothetical protein
MLKSYEVVIEGDRITWLGKKPSTQTIFSKYSELENHLI